MGHSFTFSTCFDRAELLPEPGKRALATAPSAGPSFTRLALGAVLVAALLGPAWGAEPPSPAPASAAKPALELKELTKDGGTIEEGTILKYHFEVKNPGDADLEITQVKPSCGCTVPHWDKQIPHGKKGSIDAEVNTLHFRGAILKHLTVFSNDPQHPELELSLTAKVTPLIQVDPGVVALVTVDDKPVTQVFTLERAGGRPMQVSQVILAVPYLKSELTPLPGKGRYQLTLTATTDTPFGRSPASVVVRTDVEKAENLTLTLIVDRGIVVTPPMVFWNVPPGEIKTPLSNIVLIMRNKGPFHVTGAKIDDPKLQVKIQTAREGAEYHAMLTYAGGWEAGLVRRTLTVTTDDPKQPVLTIPVQAMVGSQLPTVTAAGTAH